MFDRLIVWVFFPVIRTAERRKPPLCILFLNILYLFSLLEILFDYQPSKWFLQIQYQCIYPVIIGSNFNVSLNCLAVFIISKHPNIIALLVKRMHITSWQPYWISKTIKRRPCWCTKPILWEFNSFLM